jgi:hypothetical protein
MTGEMERGNWRRFRCSRFYRVNYNIFTRYNSMFPFFFLFSSGVETVRGRIMNFPIVPFTSGLILP